MEEPDAVQVRMQVLEHRVEKLKNWAKISECLAGVIYVTPNDVEKVLGEQYQGKLEPCHGKPFLVLVNATYEDVIDRFLSFIVGESEGFRCFRPVVEKPENDVQISRLLWDIRAASRTTLTNRPGYFPVNYERVLAKSDAALVVGLMLTLHPFFASVVSGLQDLLEGKGEGEEETNRSLKKRSLEYILDKWVVGEPAIDSLSREEDVFQMLLQAAPALH